MPQVSGVHTVLSHQLLHFLVLRKQCHKRHGTALEHMAQVFQQRKRRALHQRNRLFGAKVRFLRETLSSGLHQTDQLRWLLHPHHLQGPLHLVQVLPGNTDACGINGIQVGRLGNLYITNIAIERLDHGFQRAANLITDPRQWPKIPLFCLHCVFRFIFDSHRHATVPDCGSKMNNRRGQTILNRATD
ncbi:hypothetical protein D3C72_1797630 [compost metagenome]